MIDSFTKELTVMGIPFFGTKRDLIRDAPDKEGPVAAKYPDNEPMIRGTISRRDLLDLQRRMIETLEDLCRD